MSPSAAPVTRPRQPLVACLGALLLSPAALHAASYVQGAAVIARSATADLTATLRNIQAPGDLNLVFIAWRTADADVVSVTDTRGNLYLRIGALEQPGVASERLYYAPGILKAPAQGNTLRVRFSAPVPQASVRIAEYHGIDLVQPLGPVFGAAGAGTLASTQSAPTSAEAMVVFAVYAGVANLAPGAGYTQRLWDEDGQILADRLPAPPGVQRASAPLGEASWYLIQAVALHAAPTAPLVPPYGASRIASGVHWDFSTVPSHRQAVGSDIWAMTWAPDGNLYGAFGDGGGFDGTERSKATGRTSLGFARISGSPQLADARAVVGRNVWGQAPRFAENQATFGGKVGDLICVGGVLYAQGGLWTGDNCHCDDPTLRRDDNPKERTLAWSRDLGKSWQIAPWHTPADLGSSLQFGPDYAGAADPEHVYLYYQPDVLKDATRIYLRRVRITDLTGDPQQPGHFEYFAGTTPAGGALWSAREGDAVAVFNDPQVPRGVYAVAAAVYDAPLGRYLLAAWHDAPLGRLGFFEAPTPWGPWATLAYYEDWGGFNETAGEGTGLSLPTKWMSADGRTLWVAFSGENRGADNEFDSLNLIRATLDKE